MWNDTDIPLAVFFTFRCYGTWLHGDERGSVDRDHNTYRPPKIPPNSNWRKHNEQLLLHPPVMLNAARRKSVEKAIRDLCNKRNWELLAIHIRTNHVHAVVRIGSKRPNDALIALKANATRQLREDRLWLHEHTPWAEKGSKRRLWNEKSVWEACNYNKVTNYPTSTGGGKNPVAIAPGSDPSDPPALYPSGRVGGSVKYGIAPGECNMSFDE